MRIETAHASTFAGMVPIGFHMLPECDWLDTAVYPVQDLRLSTKTSKDGTMENSQHICLESPVLFGRRA